MMYGYIYLTTCLVNSKKYVGLHRGEFDHNYLGTGKLILQAIKKYGKENFKVEMIDIAFDHDSLNEKEIFWMALFKTHVSQGGYNLSPGGGGCKGIYGENHWNYGRVLSDETKSKIGSSSKINSAGENNGMYGKKHTEKTKEKMRQKAIGRQHTQEAKHKMSIARKGKFTGDQNPMYGKKHAKKSIEIMKNKLSKESNYRWISRPYKTLEEFEYDKEQLGKQAIAIMAIIYNCSGSTVGRWGNELREKKYVA